MSSPDLNGPSVEVAKTTAFYAFWNNAVACVLCASLSFVANYILIKAKSIPPNLKKAYVFFKFLEVGFNVSFVIACPMFVAIETDADFQGLMIVNAGIKLPSALAMIFLMLSIALLTQLIFVSPIVYFVRYLQICRKGVHPPHVITVIVLNIILLLLSAGLLCYASSTTLDDIIILSGIAVNYVGHETVFLVLSYDKIGTDITAYISSGTYFLILVFSMVLMAFSHMKINSKINSNLNMSENLKKMQARANQILTSQFIMTLIFVQIPFFYSVLGPMVGASQKLVTYLLSILFVWGPVANTLSLFIFKTQVRQSVFGCSNENDSTVINVADRSAMKSDMKL
ncbi:CBN-SRM-6 protein [Caenorhabditis brenneri]|uniref:CBN-SRM-6 protein n=1 Tax=Caenorhabditis brenneri TaxID=135651 RepID=G0NMA6_CAEBE|nr:CBN-SRM-6 protein [Caenorhabditis brenneri]